jgi:hypothetical protein
VNVCSISDFQEMDSSADDGSAGGSRGISYQSASSRDHIADVEAVDEYEFDALLADEDVEEAIFF